MTIPSDTSSTVKPIDQSDHGKDQVVSGAYLNLIKEYNESRISSTSLSGADIKERCQQATNNLVSDGKLPGFALVGAMEQNDFYKATGQLSQPSEGDTKGHVTENPDGSKVKTNNSGQVTEVIYNDGKTRTFTYAPDGTLNELTDKAGNTWRKGGDNKFHFFNTDNRDNGNTASEISVSCDGKISIKFEPVKLWIVDIPTDVAITYNTDGSSLSRDRDGRVSRVKYASGTNRTFSYDSSGEMNKIGETDGSIWIRESDGKWHQSRDYKSTGQTNDANPTVTSDGQYSTKNVDGSTDSFKLDGTSEVKRADGTVLENNANGHLTTITYPDGAIRAFERDDKGYLTRIKNDNGSSWAKVQGQWQHIDASGKELEQEGYAPRVFADGSFSVAENEGSVYNGNADGTIEAKRGDGSTVKYDAHGNVQSIEYIAGGKRSFTYDRENQLTSFTDTNGKTSTSKNGTWQTADGVSYGSQSVTIDGTGALTIGYENGSKNKYLTNGSALNTDGNDQVIHITYRDGKQRDFQRDQDGNITAVTEPDGHKWSKNGDGNWHEYESGKPTDQINNFIPEIDDQGNYKIKSANGSFEIRRSDGSTVRARNDGLVTEVDYGDGKKRTFEYNNKNELVLMREGELDAITFLDEHGNWKRIEKPNLLDRKDADAIWRVSEDGTIHSYNGADVLTSSKDVTSHPNPGNHELWGEHADNPLAAITPEAIHQGMLGDCYFLAALASMADADPQSVKNILHDNGDGTYIVTFPGDPEHPVTVDCPTEQEMGAYAHDDGIHGMWVNVIEKAHRKYSGRETSDFGDQADTGVKLLIPKSQSVTRDDLSSFIGIGQTDKTTVEKDIERALAMHQIIVANTTDGDFFNHLGTTHDPGSLVNHHVFAVTDYNSTTQTVTMRNPWGGDGQEGTFTLSLNDFYDRFTDMNFANA